MRAAIVEDGRFVVWEVADPAPAPPSCSRTRFCPWDRRERPDQDAVDALAAPSVQQKIIVTPVTGRDQ